MVQREEDSAKLRASALDVLRNQLEDAERRRARLEQQQARAAAERKMADVRHAAELGALRARTTGRIAAAQRAAEVALQAQETDMREQAARQVEAAVREQQVEAARIFVETMRRHDALMASTRAEAEADVAQAQEKAETLEREFADHVEQQVAARVSAAGPPPQVVPRPATTEPTPQFTNRGAAATPMPDTLGCAAAALVPSGAVVASPEPLVAPESDARSTRSVYLEFAVVVVLAGVTGTLVGWLVSLTGLF